MTKQKPAKKTKKLPGVGLCCRECSGPLFVIETKARGRTAIDRIRCCPACRLSYPTTEVMKGK